LISINKNNQFRLNYWRKLFYGLKIALSLGILSYLISKINWSNSFATIQQANYLWLIFTLILKLSEWLLLTYKWNILLKIRGIFISFHRLLAINMIGGFWGLFLPSSLGVDVVRGYYLFKSSSDKAKSASSIIIDRFFAFFSLLIFVGVALLFPANVFLEFPLGNYIIGFLLIIITCYTIFQTNHFSDFLIFVNRKLKSNSVVGKAINLRTALLEYTYITIAWSFGIYIPIIYYFIFCPLIILILMVPISIGGFGLREGAFVAFFTKVGMQLEDAVIISLTSSLITNFVTLFGGVIYLFYKSEVNTKNSNYSDNVTNSEKVIINWCYANRKIFYQNFKRWLIDRSYGAFLRLYLLCSTKRLPLTGLITINIVFCRAP